MRFLSDIGEVLTEKYLGYCSPKAKIAPTVVIKQPEKVFLDDYAVIEHYTRIPCELHMGKFAKIGTGCVIIGGDGKLTMEEFSEIAPHCEIVVGSNNYRGDDGLIAYGVPQEFHGHAEYAPVQIGAHALFGVRTTILPGTIVPEGLATGVGTLLKPRPLKEWTLYAGNPIREIGPRDGTKILAAKRALYKKMYGEQL